MVFKIIGICLMTFGAVFSILFWLPRVLDRNKLKQALGERYQIIYVIYLANGPGMILLGLLILKKFI